MIEAGKKCSEVRALLRHNKTGGFDGWVEAENIGKTAAYRLIGMYETFGNRPNLGQLNIAKTAAYLLAAPSTPEPARIEAELIVQYTPMYNVALPLNSRWITLSYLRSSSPLKLPAIRRTIKSRGITDTNGYYRIADVAHILRGEV